MYIDPCSTISTELLRDVAKAAGSLKESSNMLARLSRQPNAKRHQAETLIRTSLFKIRWLATRFEMDL